MSILNVNKFKVEFKRDLGNGWVAIIDDNEMWRVHAPTLEDLFERVLEKVKRIGFSTATLLNDSD